MVDLLRLQPTQPASIVTEGVRDVIIVGAELMASMRKQAERFGAEFVTDNATELDLTGELKTVTVAAATYRARAVIRAMGSRYREIGLANEKRLSGHGVSWLATCDGFFFRGRRAGRSRRRRDSALEEAIFLTRFADSVTVVHRRDALRASKAMQQRAFADPKIRFPWNRVVDDVLGANKVEGVAVRNVHTGESAALDVTGLFVAIGHDPRSELTRGQVDLDAAGYLLGEPPSTRTTIPGVFACGDLVDHTYRQAITAAGSGCAAALDAERWLASHEARTTHTRGGPTR